MYLNPKPRRLTPCRRHPDLPTTTGLCAPCLHERLSLLSPSTSSAVSASSTASVPELRRCKTFSAKNCDNVIGLSVEPRRRSCDVRGRSSLSSLFNLDDTDDGENGVVSGVRRQLKVESKNLGLTCPVPEVLEEEDDDEEIPEAKVEVARVSHFGEGEFDDFEGGKSMKEFIDLELQSNLKPSNKKDLKVVASNFFVAASVFTKKLRKWRRKQEESSKIDGNRCRNRNGIRNGVGNGTGDGLGVSLGEMRLENLRGRRLSYTQSEVGDYGFGRRSIDTDPRGSVDLGRASIDCGGYGRKSSDSDPRFSIDLGRASVDCGRMSVDEERSEFDAPRASWDGCLLGGGRGGRALPRAGGAPVVSVIENAMATVYGFDNRVFGEGKAKVENGDERQRKGFDRSKSVRRDMVVMPEGGDEKALSNARVSPAAIGVFDGSKLLITEKELNEWRLNSMKDDSSESFETASKDLASVSSSSNGKDYKKCRQWTKLWKLWGLLNRRKGDKCGDEDEFSRERVGSPGNSARNGNRETLVRSHSTTSSRGSSSLVGSTSGTISRTESKAIVRRRQEDAVLERTRSARFSPSNLDNGLLRFYLTPLRSRRRNRLGTSRLKKSQSLARSVLSLY